MIDTSNAEWDLSKEEKFAIEWFEHHGFSGSIKKQYVAKTVFVVSKDGFSDTFSLSQGLKNIDTASIMSQFEKYWEMYCKVSRNAAP